MISYVFIIYNKKAFCDLKGNKEIKNKHDLTN